MKPKKHTISRPRSSIVIPKGYTAKIHNPDIVKRYIREFEQLNNLKALS